MDDDRFDRLALDVVRGVSRHRLLRRLSALPFAAGLAVIVAAEEASEAKKHHHKKRKHKKKRHTACRACGSTGCCDGGTCQPGDRAAACGTGGATCATCSGATPVCFAGACVCDVCANGCQFSSMQAAIDAAGDGDIIRVCAGTFSGNLTIIKRLTIVGAGQGADPATDTILNLPPDVGGTVVSITEAVNVTLQKLRITGGSATIGGGIFNAGTLALTDCTVSGNRADPGFGGGILNNGQVMLDHTTVSGNSALINGGGIFNSSGATSICIESDVSDNSPHNCVAADSGGCDGCGD